MSESDRIERRAALMLGALVGLYGGVLMLLAALGRFTFVWKTSIVPALLLTAVLSRRVVPFIRDWAVFLASIVLFECSVGLVFGLIMRFELPFYADYVITWDQALLGGRTLPNLLQDWLFHGRIGWLEKSLVVVHGSHFIFFLFFGALVWLTRRDQFWRFRGAMVMLMVLGAVFYMVVPTLPPWMASQYHLLPPLRHISQELYNLIIPTLQRTFDTNPIGAMPSLHAAFPALCAFIGVHLYGWRRGVWLWLYTLAMCFSIGYLAEHYLVDIILGVALAGVLYLACYRWQAIRPPSATGRFASLRAQLLLAAVFALAAEGVGQLGVVLREGRDLVTPAFVASELTGKSDRAHIFLGLIAAKGGDGEGARREFLLALDEARDPTDRKFAEELIAHVGEAPRVAPRMQAAPPQQPYQ
jgi:membrane-associated phospholipid phosphatase